MPTKATIVLLSLTALLGTLLLPTGAGAQTFELITDQNRNHAPPGAMAGGWGPHLRSVMRSPAGELWFAYDEGPDVQHNHAIRYMRRTGGQWIHAGFNDLTTIFGSRIQQNTAHVMVGTFIYSYGVDVDRRRLVECFLNTLVTSHKGCSDVVIGSQPYPLPSNTNYVGAAVSPGGFRIVWWSQVGAPGKLFHTWNFGGGWNGPVVTPAVISGNSYANIGYLRPVFSSDNTLELLGQMENSGFFVSTHVSIAIDNSYPQAVMGWIGPQSLTTFPEDIWADRQGGLHAITHHQSPSNTGAYFHKPAGGSWTFVQSFPGLTAARFQEDDCGEILHLLADSNGSLILRSGSVAGHSGPLDFSQFSSTQVQWPKSTDLSQPNAIYTMSRAYQTQDVRGLHFALVGRSPAFDHQIFHFGDPD
ncbi:MAG: hypothetical protein AAGN66_08150 [Acidobacteriota bacterium]